MSRRRFLYIHPLECTGCRICEITCSLRFYKEVNPHKSRIHVIREDPAIDRIVACHHCDDPWCLHACQEGAIVKTQTGQVIVKPAKCTGCGACVDACPFGAISIEPDSNKAILCTLCGECVKNCPVHKLRIENPDSMSNRIKWRYLQKRSREIEGRLPRSPSK
ncbi:MAG: 4Fe-4S dicluster domain-containing protein [Candidatus Ranarchaeia archaeon]